MTIVLKEFIKGYEVLYVLHESRLDKTIAKILLVMKRLIPGCSVKKKIVLPSC